MGGHLPEEECTELLRIAKTTPTEFKHFVETGTYKADTTLMASRLFENVHTIEIVHQLYTDAVERCKDASNVHLHNGDTLAILPQLIETVITGPTVWFLDAHQSGHDTSNNGKCVPLLEELECILPRLQDPLNLFIIDDVRLFSKYWDWEGINLQTIEAVFEQHKKQVQLKFVKDDRFVILVK